MEKRKDTHSHTKNLLFGPCFWSHDGEKRGKATMKTKQAINKDKIIVLTKKTQLQGFNILLREI